MQYARIHMTKHAVFQMMTVQQRTKFGDVIRQMFRRHTGIFDKRDRFCRPFTVTEQTHRFFAHCINTLNTTQLTADLIPNHTRFIICH